MKKVSYFRGFEVGIKRAKLKPLTKRELSGSDYLRIFKFWQAEKPGIRRISEIFNVKYMLAQRLVKLFKNEPTKILDVLTKEEEAGKITTCVS